MAYICVQCETSFGKSNEVSSKIDFPVLLTCLFCFPEPWLTWLSHLHIQQRRTGRNNKLIFLETPSSCFRCLDNNTQTRPCHLWWCKIFSSSSQAKLFVVRGVGCECALKSACCIRAIQLQTGFTRVLCQMVD